MKSKEARLRHPAPRYSALHLLAAATQTGSKQAQGAGGLRFLNPSELPKPKGERRNNAALHV
jgi:hypothetical protein